MTTPPFSQNSLDAANAVVQMHAQHRQRFVAAIGTEASGPLCLRVSNISVETPKILSLHVVEEAQRPKLADFLMVLCNSPDAADSLLGCMEERFRRDCAKHGVQRAKWLYWRCAIESSWPLLSRAISRTVKWAAIISAVKRLFVG
jgi:hypothetical protein